MRQACVGEVRVSNNQRVTGKTLGILRREQHGTGPTIGQVFAVLGVGQKRQLAWTGILQGSQTGNLGLRVPNELRAELFSQARKGQRLISTHQRLLFRRSITWRVISNCGLTSTTPPRSSTRS